MKGIDELNRFAVIAHLQSKQKSCLPAKRLTMSYCGCGWSALINRVTAFGGLYCHGIVFYDYSVPFYAACWGRVLTARLSGG